MKVSEFVLIVTLVLLVVTASLKALAMLDLLVYLLNELA